MNNARFNEKDKLISENLKRIWKDHQYDTDETQLEFCQRIGIYQSNMSAFLNCKQRLGSRMIIKLSGALNCSPLEIDPDF